MFFHNFDVGALTVIINHVYLKCFYSRSFLTSRLFLASECEDMEMLSNLLSNVRHFPLKVSSEGVFFNSISNVS